MGAVSKKAGTTVDKIYVWKTCVWFPIFSMLCQNHHQLNCMVCTRVEWCDAASSGRNTP